MIELKYATDLQGELDLMKMCNCFSCKRAIDLIERIDGLMGEVAARAAAPAAELQHGIDCPKAAHIEGRFDYLHEATDDRPFDDGETMFCGRCHHWMGCTVENVLKFERELIHAPECVPTPCAYCGPDCQHGAEHDARVETWECAEQKGGK